MRILVVAQHYPWPAVDGIRQRLDHVVRGLASVGDVELLAIDRREGAERSVGPPDLAGLSEVGAVPAVSGVPVRAWLPRWVRGGPPRRLLELDWSPMAGAFGERMSTATQDRPPIDLVWYSHVDPWWSLHDLARGVPAIADFYDLVDLSMRLRRRTPPRFVPRSGPVARARVAARWAMSRGFDLVDERRWNTVQRRCAAHVDRVAVCSELDRERSGLTNVVVIGNGSERPDRVDADRTALRGAAPTFLFVGALDYEPNSEAIGWFVRHVFPVVREALPGATVRIVGRGSSTVSWVADEPGVEVVGPVADIGVELDRADVSIVPILVGAGTRLKVVEALANHIPLVTTSVGCEGIAVTDGVQGLIADDPAQFARACIQVATDGALRQRLSEAGAELFAERYDWAIIERRIGSLAETVVAGDRS